MSSLADGAATFKGESFWGWFVTTHYFAEFAGLIALVGLGVCAIGGLVAWLFWPQSKSPRSAFPVDPSETPARRN